MSIEKEGIVKYNLDFRNADVEIQQQYHILEKSRKLLYTLGLIGAYEDGLGYGNISQRLHQSDKFVITSTQTGHLEHLTIDDYALVETIDFDSFKTIACGKSKPSSECITHGAIYALDTRINAVIHIHNLQLWQFMLTNGYLSTNDTPYGTLEMVKDVQAIYERRVPLEDNIFVMKGHKEGIVTFGRDMDEAIQPIFLLIQKVLHSSRAKC